MFWIRLDEIYWRRFDCEGGILVLWNVDIFGVGIGVIWLNVVVGFCIEW